MTPSTPQPRAPGARFPLCPRCKTPLANPGETHLHDSQCVKALRISNAALHDVLNQQAIRYENARREVQVVRGLLFNVAHQSGGKMMVKDRGQIEGKPVLEFVPSAEDESVMIVTASVEPVPTAPN